MTRPCTFRSAGPMHCFLAAAAALSVVLPGMGPCLAQDNDGATEVKVEEGGDLANAIEAQRRTLAMLTKRLADNKENDDRNSQGVTEMLQAEIAQRQAQLRLLEARAEQQSRLAKAREVAQLQRKVKLRDDQVHELKAHLEVVLKKLADLERARELPPLEEAEFRVFALRNVQANDAARTIEALLGPGPIRVALDERTNSLIAAGKSETLQIVEALLLRLDEQAQASREGDGSAAAGPAAAAPRSLLLRIFWLADGLPEGEGEDPAKFLPRSVLRAVDQLGLNEPRLVTQTVNSLSRDANPGREVSFATGVPALIFKQPAQLRCNGRVLPIQDNRAELEVQIAVAGPSIACDLGGSLASPLGHYTVLGTANSVSADPAAADAYGMMDGGRGEFGDRGGYGGVRGGFGGRDGYTAEGPVRDQQPAEAKFNTSHFAFVVQVVENASYAEDE